MDANQIRASCEDCYFRRAGLCALRLEEPCPTFRPHAEGAFHRQQRLRLTPRPLHEVVRAQLLRQPAAA